MTVTVTGKQFCEMMVSAANSLDRSKIDINNMNVFPVPDGDTGINMALTVGSVGVLAGFDGNISDASAKAADLVLRAARGNSGAIIALFFRGVSRSLRGHETASTSDILAAVENGTKEAYKAVMNPTEGTILTVMRQAGEQARIRSDNCFGGDMVALFECMLDAAEKSLSMTPEILPVLKEAGVVDAGGCGFVAILRGMTAALRGEPITRAPESVVAVDPNAPKQPEAGAEGRTGAASTVDADIRFAYCTECVLEKDEEHRGEGTADALREILMPMGDSMVFLDDESLIKLHIHTNHPGSVLEHVLAYGTFLTVKVENMRLQHEEIIGQAADAEAQKAAEEARAAREEERRRIEEQEKARRHEEIVRMLEAARPDVVRKGDRPAVGFVAVCPGPGIETIFREFGVENIVRGGQTMNPSTDDLLEAILQTDADCVYVLPNNKNIFLVAERAAELVQDREVRVINTIGVAQGIAAMVAFTEGAQTEGMQAAADAAISFAVTHAVRNTKIDDREIHEGQLLGLRNGKIVAVEDTDADCIRALLPLMEGATFITAFAGVEVDDIEAAAVLAPLRNIPGAELTIVRGDQPIYDYIIAVEGLGI